MSEQCEANLSKPYSKGEYNKYNDTEQWIRISEGCPHKHTYCRESFENPELIVYPIPQIIRNVVKIMDMNLLCHPEAIDILRKLGSIRVHGKKVKYELICGIDYRFLTKQIAWLLKHSGFVKIRMAWDLEFKFQKDIKKAIDLLKSVGYKDITIFMICNWKIPYEINCMKLDLCKVWKVKVADCYFDNQLSPNFESIYWSLEDMKRFRAKVRKHNQLVNFGIDPEYPEVG